jgi:hypothetical protein
MTTLSNVEYDKRQSSWNFLITEVESSAETLVNNYQLTNYHTTEFFNPLTPELNPFGQRCLPRIFTRDFNF